MKKELWRLIYVRDSAHLHAARIIGYAGCSPFEFWDAAKLLPHYDQRKYQHAMEDLTIFSKREGTPPRYEFNAEARKAVRALLGPTPEDPGYADYWSGQVHQPGMKDPWVPEVNNVPSASPSEPKPKKKTRKKKAG